MKPKLIKSISAVPIILFFLLPLHVRLYADSDTVTISKIRILIEENKYIWENRKSIPEKTEGKTAPSTVISFLSFAPGDTLTTDKLEKEVKLAEIRLMNSGYFYNARVIIIPPRKKPESRTILIKIKEGFPYRFGGGNAYGMFGMENLWGKRKRFNVAAGYNLAGGTFVDENFLNRNLILGSSLFYSNQGFESSKLTDYNRLDAKVLAGIRPHPDLLIGLDFGGRLFSYTEIFGDMTDQFLGDRDRRDILISPYIEYKISGIHLEAGSGICRAQQGDITASMFLKAAGKYELFRGHSINLQVSGGSAVSALPYPDKFDLYATEDLSIRSDQEILELLADQFFLTNFEYRFHLLKFFVPPFLNIVLGGFLYSDLGWTSEYGEDLFEKDLKDAYGAGIRLLFDNPVFAYFSFSYGINRYGKGRFIFTATGGF